MNLMDIFFYNVYVPEEKLKYPKYPKRIGRVWISKSDGCGYGCGDDLKNGYRCGYDSTSPMPILTPGTMGQY